MNRTEKLFRNADFSKETDLKDRLRAQLFGGRKEKGVEHSLQTGTENLNFGSKKNASRRFPIRELSDDELELVNAAGDIHSMTAQDYKRHRLKGTGRDLNNSDA